MKRFLTYFSVLLLFLACSKDTETPVPTPQPKPKFTVTITSSEGGSVSTSGGTYEQGTTVSVTASASSGYVFSGWSNGETSATLNIVVTGNISISANFDRIAYSVDVSGAISKGAFLTGSTLTFYELDDDLNQTGKSYNTDIVDDYGTYSLSVTELTEDFARVVGEGYYWSEVTNQITEEKLSLNAISEIKEGINVNILSHLEYPRVEYLIKSEGKSFVDAKKQALIEVLSSLGIETTTDYGTSEEFTFKEGDDRSKILLVTSSLLQSDRKTSEIVILISKIASDLRDNGNIDDQEIKVEIARDLYKLDITSIAAQTAKKYEELNPNLTAESFSSDYLEIIKSEFNDFVPDSDGDGIQDELDLCADTPEGLAVNEFGCSDNQQNYSVNVEIEGQGTVTKEVVTTESTTSIRLTAVPSYGYKFDGWSGDVQSSDNPLEVTLNQDYNLKAIFVENIGTLNLTVEGEGEVSVQPEQEVYEFGSIIQITASPGEEWLFSKWTGDIESTENPLELEFNSSMNITAVFKKKQYDLEIEITGEGTVEEELIQPPTLYETGTTVKLTAVPSEGWEFVSWGGDLEGTENPEEITISSNKTVSVVFEMIDSDGDGVPDLEDACADTPEGEEADENGCSVSQKEFDLTVTIEGEGTVSEELVVATSKYQGTSNVRLTATASTGWEFSEWTGDVTGTENPITIEIDGAKSVTAVFTKKDTDGDGVPDLDDICPDTPEGEEVNENGCNGTIYLDENGVTIKVSPEVSAGDEIEFDGVTYTVVDNDLLEDFIDQNKDLSKVVTTLVTSLEQTFQNRYDFNSDISHWDTSNVTEMNYTFAGAEKFDQDISYWNTSAVTTMEGMFNGARVFTEDISTWDVSSVETMRNMFAGANNFNEDLNTWDVSAVEDMYGMFQNTQFNGDIDQWDVSSVENMSYMFHQNERFDQDLNDWDVSSVVSMQGMFQWTYQFDGDISAWDVSSVENMASMFHYAYNFDGDISAWDVSSVENMSYMFYNASSFDQNIGGWDVSNVRYMDQMFYNATSFNQDLAGWCVDRIDNQPSEFSRNSGLETNNLPRWGTCNDPNTDSDNDGVRDLDDLCPNTPEGATVSASGCSEEQYDSGFSLEDNGVTITYSGTTPGAIGVVNGTEYIAVDNDLLEDFIDQNKDLSKVVTTLVTSLEQTFQNRYDFNSDISHWDTSNVTEMNYTFAGAEKFDQDISYWNTSAVTTMEGMFNGARVFTEDISTWDVSSVETMRNMFAGANNFNEDLNTWDVSAVEDMYGMFQNTQFNGDIDQWDVSSVENMSYMFHQNERFDQDLNDWDVSSVVSMQGMFQWTYQFDGDISAWDVSSVENMASMFHYAYNFDGDISAWDVSSVENMSYMFYNASSFDQNIGGWDVSNVRYMDQMFYNATSFNQDLAGWCVDRIDNQPSEFSRNSGLETNNLPRWGTCNDPNTDSDNDGVRDLDDLCPNTPEGATVSASGCSEEQYDSGFSLEDNGVTITYSGTTPGAIGVVNGTEYIAVDNDLLEDFIDQNKDLSKVVTTLVTSLEQTFQNRYDFNSDISHWDTSNVTEMNYTFAGAEKFDQDISYWNTSAVTTMEGMFNGARVFTEDISTWDVSSVETMRNMFAGANNFNEDLNTWDVSAVEDMYGMFQNTQFNGDIDQWDVSSVENMSYMFHQNERFDQDLNDWDVSSVVSMQGMFQWTYQFDGDISAWDVSSVENMASMFHYAYNFDGDISAWDVSSVENMSYMFYNASSFDQNIGGWDVSNVRYMDQMFYNATSFNQDLAGWCVDRIDNQPSEFSRNSGLETNNLPKWGTCPD